MDPFAIFGPLAPAVLAIAIAGTGVVKRILGPRAKSPRVRRFLPLVSGACGAAAGAFMLPGPLAQRVALGAVVGLLGPAVHATAKRRAKATPAAAVEPGESQR